MKIFRVRFIAFPWVEFPQICCTVKHISAFLVPVDKKNHETKLEIQEESTKFQIAMKLPLKPRLFLLLNDRQENFHKL